MQHAVVVRIEVVGMKWQKKERPLRSTPGYGSDICLFVHSCQTQLPKMEGTTSERSINLKMYPPRYLLS
jgi:hypothetical protein